MYHLFYHHHVSFGIYDPTHEIQLLLCVLVKTLIFDLGPPLVSPRGPSMASCELVYF